MKFVMLMHIGLPDITYIGNIGRLQHSGSDFMHFHHMSLHIGFLCERLMTNFTRLWVFPTQTAYKGTINATNYVCINTGL